MDFIVAYENVMNRTWQYAQYCTECDSESCLFNPDGICLAPIILGRDLDCSEEQGCHDYVDVGHDFVDDGENW